MSEDIFANASGPRPASRAHFGFGNDSLSRAQDGNSPNLFPRYPEAQELMDAMDAERYAEIARKEVEMDTPENRQKALEAEVAERERKRINFHFARAMPSHLKKGWKHLREELTDEEIRVYTTDYGRIRFWGIKPAGMAMHDFWEQNDPEIGRYDDNVAMTWENPLIPPPVTKHDEHNPVIWAGQGLNPDLTTPEPAVARVPPPKKAATNPRKRQKTPDLNSNHRVRKSTTKSSKVDKNTRKSLAHKLDAGDSGLEDQVREVPMATHANARSTRNKTAFIASNAQQKSYTEDKGPAPSKRPRGRPAANKKLAANDSKRPRGRPTAKEKLAEKSQKQKKTPAVKGSAKPSQTERRPAPSTHQMRTRGKGPAELLKLP